MIFGENGKTFNVNLVWLGYWPLFDINLPSTLFSWLINEGKYFLEFYFQNFSFKILGFKICFNEINAKGISSYFVGEPLIIIF